MKKGTYGYIQKKKAFQAILAFGLFALALTIFFVGSYLNKGQKNNIFSIIAVLVVLPAAEAFVHFIVVAPYKTVERKKYDKINELITKDMILLTDLVITSSKKIMNLNFLIIIEDNVIGVVGRPNQNIIYIENYLTEGIKDAVSPCHVKIFKDYKSFLNRVSRLEDKENGNKNMEKIKAYLLSLNI